MASGVFPVTTTLQGFCMDFAGGRGCNRRRPATARRGHLKGGSFSRTAGLLTDVPAASAVLGIAKPVGDRRGRRSAAKGRPFCGDAGRIGGPTGHAGLERK